MMRWGWVGMRNRVCGRGFCLLGEGVLEEVRKESRV